MHIRQITNGLWTLFIMMALAAGEPLVRPVLAASAANIGVVALATGKTTAIAVGDTPSKAVQQGTVAATTEKVGGKVSIANFTFTPAEITIAAGESITWTNDDGAPHGLAYEDGAKGTDLLLPGASFNRQFDRPGTYDYSCAVHPYMTGRVVVRAQ